MSEAITPELVQDTPDFSGIVNVAERKAAECKYKIETLIKEDNSSKYELCLALNEAFTNEYGNKFWGMSLQDYADRVLNIGWRDAYFYVSIGKMISLYGVDRITKEDFSRVGWTKLRMVAGPVVRALEADNTGLVNKLLALTTTETAANLPDKVKQLVKQEAEGVLKDDTEKEREAPFRLSAGFHGEEAELVRSALVEKCLALDLDPNDKKSAPQALAGIVTDWARMQGSVGTMTVEDWIGWINKKYNVTLVPVAANLNPDALLGGFEAAVESNKVGSFEKSEKKDFSEEDLNEALAGL